MAAGRVLAEMRSLGLQATEAGPDGFLPDDAAALRDLLAAHGLSLAGGFVPLVLHAGGGWRGRLRLRVSRLAACGGEIAVLAAATGLDGYDARPTLDAGQWRRLLRALDEAAGIAADAGLRAVLHPHIGTVVEQPDEIDRVLAGSGVQLCLDTGHVRAAGGDPAGLAARAAERIGHVHLKDVRAGLAARLTTGAVSYGAAVRAGLYCRLGEGDAGIGRVARLLDEAGYDGWYVLEQDLMLEAGPAPGHGPAAGVAACLDFLRGALGRAP
jgi:inosose dehydratase